MAAADPWAELLEETTCSICRELFTDPVTLDCGHSFCLSCLRTYMSKEDLEKACPECKHDIDPDKEMKPNKRLASIAEMVKKLQIVSEDLCEEHGERLQFFCETDGELLCVICRQSRAHSEHRVKILKEAEQEYKEKLHDWLCHLRKEEGCIQESKLRKEEQCNTMRNKVRAEKQKIASDIDELHQILRDKERTLHQILVEMEKTITRVENANITKLSNKITSLNVLISDLEKKCEESALDLLKMKLQDWLRPLRNEKRYILESKLKEEEQYNTMRVKVRAEKQKCATEIEELHQLLREKEQTLNQRLDNIEKTTTIVENAYISKLSNHTTSLNALIIDLEKKCREPALELLKDFRSTLNRCAEVKFQSLEQIKEYKVTVTLDPDTAHPELRLSEGGRRVGPTYPAQLLPDTPKRFTSTYCVLGSEGFTSGRHYWEVQLLQEGGGWAVGVAAESMEKKRWITWSPEEGLWAVRWWKGQYKALTSPLTHLFPPEKPMKLGLYLDYEGGRLSLYNVSSMELLYTFPRAPFTHRLFPFFYLWGAGLRLE